MEGFSRKFFFYNVMGLYIAVKITWEGAGWKTSTYMFYTYYVETMKNTVLTSRVH